MAKSQETEYEYNPIKVAKDGGEAERVIWSTKAIETAIEGIKKGLPLKANPFIGKDTGLLKPDLVYKRTQEELNDYMHCMQDPVYFASKCYLMTPQGLQPCVLRDYQIDYLHHLQEHRFSVLLAARQIGKCIGGTANITLKIEKNTQIPAKWLVKYYYYIDDNYIFINLPIFELYHLYEEKTFVNNIKYHLYKYIYLLIYGKKGK